MNKVYFKRHKRFTAGKGTSIILALCDEELLGKKFAAGKSLLDLESYRSFYEGELLSAGEVKKRLEEELAGCNGGVSGLSISINLVGKNSLAVAVEHVDVKKAKKIKGVPHLQMYWV